MLCPSCSSIVKKRSNFCRYCGQSIPILVGADYPFGIRFPCGPGAAFAVVVNAARKAPRYFVQEVSGVSFHVALYDRPHVPDLAHLYRLLLSEIPSVRHLVEHTTDGRTFFSGPSFWSCMADRLTDDRVVSPDVAHPSVGCHSVFGCIAAQRRQHEMYHREGWEVFYPDRHGLVPDGDPRTFVVDRAKIKAEVLNLIRRAGTHRCPIFRPSRLDAAVRSLPSVVEIGETPGWDTFVCSLHGQAFCWSCY